jgi:hypothetical protein
MDHFSINALFGFENEGHEAHPDFPSDVGVAGIYSFKVIVTLNENTSGSHIFLRAVQVVQCCLLWASDSRNSRE